MLELAYKRLREAAYFLNKAREYKQCRYHHEPDEFEFLLNAYLNAGRGVQYAAICSAGGAFKLWQAGWELALDDDDQLLFKSMIDQRIADTHTGESISVTDVEWVPISRMPAMKDGGHGVFFGPPDVPESAIGVEVLYFEIGSETLEALECCSRHYQLLERMLAEYESFVLK